MLTRYALRVTISLGLLLSCTVTWSQQVEAKKLTPEAIQEIAQQAAKQAAEAAAKEAAKQTVEQLSEQAEQAEAAEQAVDGEKQKATAASQTKPASQATSKVTRTSLPNRLRIGSGSVGGNYFVLGELIGGSVSHPAGSLPCGKGGTCGVRNLQSENVTSAGALANLAALKAGDVDTAFVQSDVAYWAYTATGLFANKEATGDLRAIASLYPEAIHIVIRKERGINSVADLRGKRVSVGARKSGTLLQSRLVLAAYQLSEDDLETEYLNNQQSIEKLINDELDAMFFSVGAPAPALTQLFSEHAAFTLLSLGTAEQQAIFREGHYFFPYNVPANTYPKIGEVQTISVYALWLCLTDMDEELVYQLTKALWSDTSRQLLNSSYIGKQINIEHSLNGIGIPLHKGAKKYYNDIGKRF